MIIKLSSTISLLVNQIVKSDQNMYSLTILTVYQPYVQGNGSSLGTFNSL
jgi:hypothetical protein